MPKRERQSMIGSSFTASFMNRFTPGNWRFCTNWRWLVSEPIGNNPLTNLSTNNYKWGLEFKMPILLRKERGEVKLANLKIEEKSLDLSYEQAQINFQIKSSIMESRLTSFPLILWSATTPQRMLLMVKCLWSPCKRKIHSF